MARQTRAKAARGSADSGVDDPLWYKDAVIYQLHVRSFYDSDGNGIGDFQGLTQKLDYLQDLGVTTLWLLPFYPSPLRDDGYDIADYSSINPAYGTLKDFKTFVAEAHQRGLRVITELVINHTSDQHPWFQRARHAKPGSVHRDFYVWSATPEKYADARIIFKDFEPSNWTWDPISKEYYWHRFFSHQPDLNFENPVVGESVMKFLDYWMDMGVDGLRLDAIPYLFEQEGTNCENLPRTHEFLKTMRKRVDERYPGRIFMAEANQWPEDAIAYFGDGDECHTAFHFPVMPRLYMALHMEDRFPILDILQQTPQIPENCQWIMFLRNHDELTLEMVTDEERDYMYRAYAHDRQARINLGIRRRLAPLLGNNRARMQLMNGLLFSLPGTPVVYYGDEIGMGDNIYLGDRHGVRTPMQWSPDRNAGFSATNSQRLFSSVIVDGEYSYTTVNVELQQKNPHSLLWWMKRLIAVRQRHPAFGRGDFRPLLSNNPKVLSFTRQYRGQTMLVVANLSRFTQFVELDLSAFSPCRPVEVFGQTRLPIASTAPYPLTLAPHVFHWFLLESEAEGVRPPVDGRKFVVDADALDLFKGSNKAAFETLLSRHLADKHWFAGKSRGVSTVRIEDAVPLSRRHTDHPPILVVLRVEYREGEAENYMLLCRVAWEDAATQVLNRSADPVFAHLRDRQSGRDGILYDASIDPASMLALLDVGERGRRVRTDAGEVVGWHGSDYAAPAQLLVRDLSESDPHSLRVVETFVLEDKQLLKIFHRIEPGPHPELAVGRLLGDQAEAACIPQLLGAIEYRRVDEEPATLAIIQKFEPQSITVRQLSQDWVGRFMESVLALSEEHQAEWGQLENESLWRMAESAPPESVKELLAGYLDHCQLLGDRLARYHLATSSSGDAAFSPEPFSKLFQRSLYQTQRKLLFQASQRLRSTRANLPADAQEAATALLDYEKEMLESFRMIIQTPLTAPRIRCHANLHLGQILFTGKDFLISDFENDLNRSHMVRRIKQSALCDIASIVSSLHYVAMLSIANIPQLGVHTPQAAANLRHALELWHRWSSSAVVKGYQTAAAGSGLLPASVEERNILMQHHLVERALLTLTAALERHPETAGVRINGLLELFTRPV